MLPAVLALAAQPEFKVHNGDHVLFYGDSITEQHLYTNYVETFDLRKRSGLYLSYYLYGDTRKRGVTARLRF